MNDNWDFDKYEHNIYKMPYYLRNISRHIEEYSEQLDATRSIINNIKAKTSKSDLLHKKFLWELTEEYVFIITVIMDNIEVLKFYYQYILIIIVDMQRNMYKIKLLSQENEWLKKIEGLISKKLNVVQSYVRIAQAEKSINQTYYELRRKSSVDNSGNMELIDDYHELNIEEYVPILTKVIYVLGLQYIQQQNFEVLESFILEKIEKYKLNPEENALELATLYTILGQSQEAQGQLSKAYNYYEKCYNLRITKLKNTNDAIGVTLTRMAFIQFKRKLYQNANELATSALNIRSQYLSTHIELGDLLDLLGNINFHLNQMNECINYTNKALKIYEQALDLYDTVIIKCYMRTAYGNIKLKEFVKASEILTMLCDNYRELFKDDSGEFGNFFKTINDSILNSSTKKVMKKFTKKYGKIENIINKQLYELIIEYYIESERYDVAHILKTCLEQDNEQNKISIEQRKESKKSHFSNISLGSFWSKGKSKISKKNNNSSY